MAKRRPLYYKKPDDRELIRDSDLGLIDSGDPMETDGSADEEELAGEPDGPADGFSVPLKADQKMVGGLTVKLRKKGMPKA